MQMATFPYQHHHLPYAPDFSYPPSIFSFDLPPPSAQQEAGHLAGCTSSFVPCYCHTFDSIDHVFPAETSTVHEWTSSISAITTAAPTPENSSSFWSGGKVSCVDNKITSSSCSAQRSEVKPKTQCSPQKKRKDGQRCNSESAQSKDSVAGRSRKLRKRSGAMKKAEEKKAPQVTPTGYVHVRARRGEATDSHSLAERVRREKIREKMKMLQDLVPGCDKVVGKALLLEEIINYVQSLKNQVEFLSMKLASMDPTIYDFRSHLDEFVIQTEKLESISPGLPNVQRTGHVQPSVVADAIKSYPVQDTTLESLLNEEGPGSFPQFFLFDHIHDIGSDFVMQVRDQTQSFLNQIQFDDLSSQ